MGANSTHPGCRHREAPSPRVTPSRARWARGSTQSWGRKENSRFCSQPVAKATQIGLCLGFYIRWIRQNWFYALPGKIPSLFFKIPTLSHFGAGAALKPDSQTFSDFIKGFLTVKSRFPILRNGFPILGNDSAILGNGFVTLGNACPILARRFSILGNASAILENGFLTLGNVCPILAGRFVILGNDFPILADDFLTLGNLFPILICRFPSLANDFPNLRNDHLPRVSTVSKPGSAPKISSFYFSMIALKTIKVIYSQRDTVYLASGLLMVQALVAGNKQTTINK